MPAFSFCGAEYSAGALNHVPRPSGRFRGVPGRESLISVSFFGVGELCQVRHGDLERLRDSLNSRPRWVAFAPLDQGEHVLRDSGFPGQHLKAVALLFTELADRAPESLL